MKKDTSLQNSSQLLIYQSEDGRTRIEVQLQEETVWLTQKLMADLFQTTVSNINLHLKNIFAEGELDTQATVKDFLIVQDEGGRQVKRTRRGKRGQNEPLLVFMHHQQIVNDANKIKSKGSVNIHELI